MLFIPRAPVLELLPAVSRLIRTGVPPLLAGPVEEWREYAACPAGHWLVPEGTRIYFEDEVPRERQGDGTLQPAEMQTPAVVLSMGEAEQMNANSLVYWMVPLSVSLILSREYTRKEIRALMAKLQRVLTEEIPTGNPATQKPWHRLSAASEAERDAEGLEEWVQVFTLGFRNVRCTVIKNQDHHPMLTLTADVNCGTATRLPAGK